MVARRHDLHRRNLQERSKLTFAKGAALDDPSGLFNVSRECSTRRAIDLHEGEKIDEEAFKAPVCAAVALDAARGRGRSS